jgi:hypothetical protein
MVAMVEIDQESTLPDMPAYWGTDITTECAVQDLVWIVFRCRGTVNVSSCNRIEELTTMLRKKRVVGKIEALM